MSHFRPDMDTHSKISQYPKYTYQLIKKTKVPSQSHCPSLSVLWGGKQIFNKFIIIVLILLVFISRVVTLIRRYINKVSPNKYKNGIMVLLLWYVDIAFGSYPPPHPPPPWASFMSWAPPCIITTNSLFRLPVSLSSMWWSHQNRLLFFPRSYSCHTPK